MREDSSGKLPFYPEREARHHSPSLPHQILSAVSACPDMLNHKQKVEDSSATDRLLSFPTHVSDTKNPNKTNPHKNQP